MKKKLDIEIKKPFRLLDDIWQLINEHNKDLSQKCEDDNFIDISLEDILGFIHCKSILLPNLFKNIEVRISENELIVNEINTLDGYKHKILSVISADC